MRVIYVSVFLAMGLFLNACGSSNTESSVKVEPIPVTVPTPAGDAAKIEKVLPVVSEFEGFRELKRMSYEKSSEQGEIVEEPEFCPGVPTLVSETVSAGDAEFLLDPPQDNPWAYKQAEFRIGSYINNELAAEYFDDANELVRKCQDYRRPIANTIDTWDAKLVQELKLDGIDKAYQGALVLHYKETDPSMLIPEVHKEGFFEVPINTHHIVYAVKDRFYIRVILSDLEEAKNRAQEILLALAK